MEFAKVMRSYSSIHMIMEGTESEFTNSATVVPAENPVTRAFQLVESRSNSHLFGFCYKELFTNVTIDEQIVGHTASKTVNFGGGFKSTRKELSVDVELIRSFATPAPFGKGSETVIDESVRKALEIKGERIETENSDAFAEMLDEIQKVAPVGKKLVPKLYKLHLYEPGGMFLKHRDTVHAANHYATLIVNLPTEYTGGAFMLEDGQGATKEFQLNSSNKYHYLIFLTDMPHQVLPVESGTRIVLQYDVYLEEIEKSMDSPSDEDEIIEEDLDYSCDSFYAKPDMAPLQTESVVQGLREEGCKSLLPAVDGFLAEHPNDQLSFLLSHQYPLSVDFDFLKGGDRVLYSLLSEKYNVTLGLAVNPVTTNYDGGYEVESANTLFVMDYDCRQKLDSFVDGNESEDSPEIVSKSYVVIGNSTSFQRVKYTGYVEYTGNEAALGEHVYASIVLSVGPPKKLE